MTQLDKFINKHIIGCRGEWYYQLQLGDRTFEGGYFYLRMSAKIHLKNKLRKIVTNDSILVLLLRSL